MFEGMYSHIQKKPTRRAHILQDEDSLEHLVEMESFDEALLIKSFISELKRLLKIENAFLLVEELFKLERKLNKLKEKYEDFIPVQLEDMYRDLSPILLQKYWERRENPSSEETIERLFLESIHIVLEEEIYIWQEKIQ